jgi:fucokinase
VLENVQNNNVKFEWVTAIAPARLDLAGTWTDTPPVTYECDAGSVTNIGILVEGEKPIGAKGRVFFVDREDRKLKTFIVRVTMQDKENGGNESSFEFENLNDFSDYNKPKSVCCLLKAVCVFTKLIELGSDDSLSEQLRKKLNGSLDVYTWTGLPLGRFIHLFIFFGKIF